MRSCKETIWAEYAKLHWKDRTHPNVRLDRDDFEMLFYNWERYVSFFELELNHCSCYAHSDMEDRISMRDELKPRLGWSNSPLLTKADWQDWREKSDKESNLDIQAFYSSAAPEVLRSMKGFVCKKAISSPRKANGQTAQFPVPMLL